MSIYNSLKLVIRENEFNNFHRERLLKKLKKLNRLGKLDEEFISRDPIWAFRYCAAELMQRRYNWFGWETRSEYIWNLSNTEWFYPKWDRRPCHLLVTAEQGLGDEILFASCFKDILKENPDTTIECDDRLRPIFERSFDCKFQTRWRQKEGTLQEKSLKSTDFRGEFDAYIPAGQLPKIYRRSIGDFPKDPYLVSKEGFSEFNGLIGVSWKGGQAELDPKILKGDVNLQYNDTYADFLQPDIDLKDDIDGVFSLVNALEKVHCVTTSVAHIAGSIGKECHVIKPAPVYGVKNNRLRWYYGLGTRTDWYPSLRVYQSEALWKLS